MNSMAYIQDYTPRATTLHRVGRLSSNSSLMHQNKLSPLSETKNIKTSNTSRNTNPILWTACSYDLQPISSITCGSSAAQFSPLQIPSCCLPISPIPAHLLNLWEMHNCYQHWVSQIHNRENRGTLKSGASTIVQRQQSSSAWFPREAKRPTASKSRSFNDQHYLSALLALGDTKIKPAESGISGWNRSHIESPSLHYLTDADASSKFGVPKRTFSDANSVHDPA